MYKLYLGINRFQCLFIVSSSNAVTSPGTIADYLAVFQHKGVKNNFYMVFSLIFL